nr:hypothetical protein HmN_000982500 [Hymenolepis microstoma]
MTQMAQAWVVAYLDVIKFTKVAVTEMAQVVAQMEKAQMGATRLTQLAVKKLLTSLCLMSELKSTWCCNTSIDSIALDTSIRR